MSDSADAFAFAAYRAIEAGDWDNYLTQLNRVVRDRIRMTKPERTPEMEKAGQVWVWLNLTGWSIRGTGVRPHDLG